MGLQHHQPGNDQENQEIGGDAVAHRAHLIFLFGDGISKVQHHRHLGNLRGLELEGLHAGDAQPPPGVIPHKADAGDSHQHQQDDGQKQQRLRRAPETLVIDFADGIHGDDADDGELRLPGKEKGGVPVLVIGGGEAGGKQHNQADHRQQQHQQAEGQIDGPPGEFPGLPFLGSSEPFFLLSCPGLLPCQGPPSGLPAGLRNCHMLLLLPNLRFPLIPPLDAPKGQQAPGGGDTGKHCHQLRLAPAGKFQMVMGGAILKMRFPWVALK